MREAGFQPNQKQGAIDDSVLLDNLIALIRELGHFPVAAEIRLKGAQDPTFPNLKTFARFGLKHELVAKLRAYCESNAGYDDVATICAVVTPSNNERPVTDGKGAEPAFGFVYLMKSGKHYKIGRSNAVGRRDTSLAFCCLIHRVQFTRSRPTTQQGLKRTGMDGLLRNGRGVSGSS